MIIIVGVIVKRRKVNSLVKMYGVPYAPTENKSAENEALEGTAGLSAQGGIVADSAWDDDVESLDFTVVKDDLDNEAIESTTIDAASLYGEDDSLEAIAGIEMETSAAEPEPTPAAPSEAPPLPPGGLPEGWTTDQWKWYGQEWLDKNQ